LLNKTNFKGEIFMKFKKMLTVAMASALAFTLTPQASAVVALLNDTDMEGGLRSAAFNLKPPENC
jgi:hypothetical protein